MNGVKCFTLFLSILWICLILRPNTPIQSSLNGVLITSELTNLPENLCCVWTVTRDLQQRKSNYPPNYRYGINLQIDRKLSHIFLLIVLAGDVAINPGPLSCTNYLLPFPLISTLVTLSNLTI